MNYSQTVKSRKSVTLLGSYTNHCLSFDLKWQQFRGPDHRSKKQRANIQKKNEEPRKTLCGQRWQRREQTRVENDNAALWKVQLLHILPMTTKHKKITQKKKAGKRSYRKSDPQEPRSHRFIAQRTKDGLPNTMSWEWHQVIKNKTRAPQETRNKPKPQLGPGVCKSQQTKQLNIPKHNLGKQTPVKVNLIWNSKTIEFLAHTPDRVVYHCEKKS